MFIFIERGSVQFANLVHLLPSFASKAGGLELELGSGGEHRAGRVKESALYNCLLVFAHFFHVVFQVASKSVFMNLLNYMFWCN